MKRFSAILLAMVMLLSLAACGGAKETEDTSAQQTPSGISKVESLFHPATSSDAGAYATVKISAEVKMDDETAWLGLCPTGKDYITEEEADDVDIIWFSYDAREEGDPYVYACDFSSVEDGTYALVVTSSDDASVGYVIIQLLMTKDGDKLTFDYTNAKYNERPSAEQLGSTESTDSTEESQSSDPAEYSREYWEAKYPGENICPFYIDENGTERSYYWVSGLDGWDGTMASWINQPFNWNGWHKAEDGCIVNEDETLKITDDWANGDEAMSSYCTVTTEAHEKDSVQSTTAGEN